jgi:hypothetical protein
VRQPVRFDDFCSVVLANLGRRLGHGDKGTNPGPTAVPVPLRGPGPRRPPSSQETGT